VLAKTSTRFSQILRAAAVVLLWHFSQGDVATAQIIVHGTRLPWSATIPRGWIGGTATKIESILAKPPRDAVDKRLAGILNTILPEAKKLDALFYGFDLEGIKTKTPSRIRVNVTSVEVESFADEKQRKPFWEAMSKSIAQEYSKDVTVEQTNDRVATTGGHKAYEATFVATQPDGAKAYTVVHLVAYSAAQTQLFILNADGTKFRDCLADFEAILGSVNYSSD
jgi:hypothetical protein